MFAEQFIVEPVFPGIMALITKLKQRLTPEQVAEQRFLNTGAVFFAEGTEGEPVRIEPIFGSTTKTGGAYQVGDERVVVEKLTEASSYDGAAYRLNGTMIYVAGDFDPYADNGKGTLAIDLSSTSTGYIANSEGKYVNFTYELVRSEAGNERMPLTPRDAAVIYCFLKTEGSQSSLDKGSYKISPLYPVVDLDTPDGLSPMGEARQPRPV
jgi:hypothetical protein